jgi:hypothetical protein
MFVKGMPRPKGAGRRPGAVNKKTLEIRDFAKGILESADYKERLKSRIESGKSPEIEKLLFHYAYGRPPDKVELSNPDGNLTPLISFYFPHNFRDKKL